MDPRDGGFFEFRQRVVFSLLRAAASVALRLRLPLDQLEVLIQMAYFREARDNQALKLDDIAEVFGKSLRTVSSLHHRYRSDFFAPERDVALRRAIAAMVNHAASDDERLRTAFPDVSEGTMRAALDDLVREGLISNDGRVWRRVAGAHEFPQGDPVERIDGLNRQMDVVAAAVWHRLIQPGRPALARSLVFRAHDDDLTAISAALADLARERAISADERAEAAGIHGTAGVTIAVAPLDESP